MAETAGRQFANREPGSPWVGQSIPRVEDAALLSGRGRFIDDLGVRPGTLHAAILRSPHAHADIVSIATSAAKQAPGVAAVLTGEDVKALTASLVVGVKAPVECWPIAIGRVRYAGEPVAIVVAGDRYQQTFTEYWTFIRRADAKSVVGATALASTCPNCGAPLHLVDGKCDYCGAYSRTSSSDWVVDTIEQVR